MAIDTKEKKLSIISFRNESIPAIPLAASLPTIGGRYHLLHGYARDAAPVNFGLGTDISGQKNDWTVVDPLKQIKDTMTNNCETLNPFNVINLTTHPIFKNGNRVSEHNNLTSGSYGVGTTLARLPFYFEYEVEGNFNPAYAAVGIMDVIGLTSFYVWYEAQGIIRYNGGTINVASFVEGDTIGVTYSPMTEEVSFYKNSIFQAAYVLSSNNGVIPVGAMRVTSSTARNIFNFGNPITIPNPSYSDQNGYGQFKYPVPNEFFACCTQNIIPYLDPGIVDGRNVFHVATRTGIGTQTDVANQFNEMEDNKALSIIKKINNIGGWDTARQGGKSLLLNDSRGEQDTVDKQIQFISDIIKGVRLGTNTEVNLLDDTYLDFVMNAQNPALYGVQIIPDRAGTSASATIPHNGGKAPSMIWSKQIAPVTDNDWRVYHKYIDATAPETYTIRLNTNAAKESDTLAWDSKKPDASNYYLGNSGATNQSGRTYVDILFFDIPFLCSAFKYEGNTDVDGPCVTLDHLSNFIFVKPSQAIANWTTKFLAQGNNPVNEVLYLDATNPLSSPTGQEADILAYAFKVRNAGVTFNSGSVIGFSFGRWPGALANAR